MDLNLDDFRDEMESRLGSLRARSLFRELRPVEPLDSPYVKIAGRRLLNCSSNDYLGLASHPALREAASRAIERFGAGAGASRLVCGSLPPHQELEEAIASIKSTEAALAFSSGYAAAVGTICALLGPSDIIVLDKLVHACVVDAARSAEPNCGFLRTTTWRIWKKFSAGPMTAPLPRRTPPLQTARAILGPSLSRSRSFPWTAISPRCQGSSS